MLNIFFPPACYEGHVSACVALCMCDTVILNRPESSWKVRACPYGASQPKPLVIALSSLHRAERRNETKLPNDRERDKLHPRRLV